jgi:hypothetical protein
LGFFCWLGAQFLGFGFLSFFGFWLGSGFGFLGFLGGLAALFKLINPAFYVYNALFTCKVRVAAARNASCLH